MCHQMTKLPLRNVVIIVVPLSSTHLLNFQSIAHVCTFTQPHTTHPVTPEQLLAGFSRSCLRRLNLDYVSLKIDTSSIFSDLILSRFSVWPTIPSEVRFYSLSLYSHTHTHSDACNLLKSI
ncbi:hypothetical protein HanPI659440_Chr12g0456541 [Helianthus annuus]|nr:hypothetical protein HanPI659440_Chr12g0456541 [Helianthus annuus]